MRRYLLLIVISFFFFRSIASAQEVTQSPFLDSFDSFTLAETTQNIDYTLPYPGLLPDNPLYVLKTMRDRVVGILISDPEKKAEFNLLQADKRLQSGVYLIEKNQKYDLALTTISKGQNYFEDAIGKMVQAKKQGTATSDMLSKMEKAAAKHEQVLTDLLTKVPAEEKDAYEALLQRIQRISKEIEKLKK